MLMTLISKTSDNRK